MQTIITASFMGSGSSAVTDLLREYENVSCPNGSYEYLFLHCPNGVFDLEDKLLRGNNALRSDEALRSFRKAMSGLFGNAHWWFADYEHKITPVFMDEVDRFISSLSSCSFEGFWYEHEKISRAKSFETRTLRKLGMAPVHGGRLYEDQMRVSFPSSEMFFGCASEFLERVLRLACKGENPSCALFDQLFLPHNLDRLNSYFPQGNAKAIVVSRDPRDVFVLNKYHWLPANCPVPLPLDVQTFCEYYRVMRKAVPSYDSSLVLEVRFEDLVLDYESTVSRIESFLGSDLGRHERPRSLFDPAVSARNVCVYRDRIEYANEADAIEKKLEEFIVVPSSDEFLRNREAAGAF